MKRIALATSAAWPELTDDDRLLIPALQQLGVEAVPVVWDARIDWTHFDRLVIRSCWDYHLRPDEFLDWIDGLEKACVAVQNPPRLVRWNIDKRYLRELSVAGATIPPTMWIEDGEVLSSAEVLHQRGWSSAIVKPTVSASAYKLRRICKDELAVQLKGPAIVQQFIPEIVSCGEWSLVFLGGKYSHAVIKHPVAEDFRVQSEFGGRTALAEPRPEMVDEAARIVGSLPGRPLYARIDGIDCRGTFILMEVELIEPELFLGLGSAANRFAEEIRRR